MEFVGWTIFCVSLLSHIQNLQMVYREKMRLEFVLIKYFVLIFGHKCKEIN